MELVIMLQRYDMQGNSDGLFDGWDERNNSTVPFCQQARDILGVVNMTKNE
jgi:hypothetical protein